jgi:hypothetical protein
MLKYTLGRLAIFVACALPAMFLLTSVDPLIRLMIALVVSAGISYFALRRWREEVSLRLAESARRRSEERERLRGALAGDGPAASGNGDGDGDGIKR